MSAWLDPLRSVLSEATRPVTFFFRDDDAGWHDDRLRRLLDVFDRFAVPIDLAVIPCALERSLARELRMRRETLPATTGLHQHGFAHVNHEREGRKCEFGPARDEAVQREDVERGRRRLEALLDTPLDPIFTPPWNRCTRATGRALVTAGVRVLSRESRVPALAVDGLDELPVDIDWFAHRKRVRLTREELGAALASEARRSSTIGLMLHHEASDAEERRGIAELLGMLAAAPSVRLVRMAELAEVAA
jgi:peptidoglycan/xylan/chitin deacetylase (PgdA/CDA1 family)